MDRRKTLGGLSPGQLNARASLGSARTGKAAAGPVGKHLDKVMSRLSLAGPVQRRSSTYAHKAAGLRSDPRPLADKGFQSECAHAIISYLATHGYDHQINMKMLQSPTTKDFTNIMLFLIRELDPSQARSGVPFKLEEEVPALFKRLRYPFQISRASLAAVGSPHTWPSVLAATAWLVGLLSYGARAEAARCELLEGDEGAAAAASPDAEGLARQRAEADFFSYVSGSYRAFMAGDDEACEAADGEKAGEFEARAERARAEAARAEASSERLRAELDARRGRPTELEAAGEALASARADRERFAELISALEAREASLARRERDRAADAEARRRELAGLEREQARLREAVSTQQVNPADVARMTRERAAAEAQLRSAVAAREALEARTGAAELELAAALDAVEAVLGRYRSAADALKLVPASSKRAAGVPFEVALDRRAGGPDGSPLLDADLKGVLRPAAEALRERYATRARELRAELLGLHEARAAAAEALRERRAERGEAEAELARADERRERARLDLESSIRDAESHVAGLAAEVETLRGSAGTGEAESAAALEAARAEHAEAHAEHAAENAALHSQLSTALEAVLEHKVLVQSRISGTLRRVRSARDEAARLGAEASEVAASVPVEA